MSYTISDHEMPVGSTLGAPKATLIVKATGALEKVFSGEAGIDVFGTLVLHHWDARSGIPLVAQPGRFVIHPYLQEHVFDLTNHVAVREKIFMLSGQPTGPDYRDVDPPGAYYSVEMRNDGSEAIEVATYASLRLHDEYKSEVTTAYDSDIYAFVVNDDDSLARIAACSVRPASYEVTQDVAKASAMHFPGPLSNTVLARSDDATGIFHLHHRLKAGEIVTFSFVLTFSLEGERPAREGFATLPDAEAALERTSEHYDRLLARGHLHARCGGESRGLVGEGKHPTVRAARGTRMVLRQ